MLQYLKSENLKFKRTFSRKLIVIAPCFFILFAFFAQVNMQDHQTYYMEMVFNWWPINFTTFGLSLLCALSSSRDKKAGGYDMLESYDISRTKFWIAKICIVAFYALISTVLLIFVVSITSVVFHFHNASFLKICTASFVIWITSIGMIPVYLFLSSRLGTVISVVSGIVGFALGVCFAPKAIWIFVPWGWPIRLMCPIIGVHPNGTVLPLGDALRNPSVIPIGILISLVFLIITVYVTSVWFTKKEAC